MTRTRRAAATLAATVLAAAGGACGDVALLGRAPVFLQIDSLKGSSGNTSPGPFGSPLVSDVLTNVTSPAPCAPESPCPTVFNDLGQAVLRIIPKDVITTTPTSSNNSVTIRRYRVVYQRTDGRNTPGVDVPYAFDGGVTGTVTPNGTLTLTFEVVRHVAKMESPLAQLVTSPTVITTIAEITFYGQDQVGNDISATGTLQIDFGNFGN
jgi:hypothetical protein